MARTLSHPTRIQSPHEDEGGADLVEFPSRAVRTTAAQPGEVADPLADGVLDAIGRTPLVRLRRFLSVDLSGPAGTPSTSTGTPSTSNRIEWVNDAEPPSPIKLYAKLESANPGGSAKDRPAAEMLRAAIAEGRIGPGSTIVESSSGNMGIGLAQACAALGLDFVCVVDPRAQPTNVAMMQALGARIERVEQPDPHTQDFLVARLRRVDELLRTIPNAFWPNQYANPANPRAHARGTMREIHEELDGRFDYVFVAISSTGTASGCQDYLQEVGSDAAVIAVDTTSSVLFNGPGGTRRIPGMGAGIEPDLARGRSFLDVLRVDDLACVVGCRRLARTEGILVGGSAGGVLEAIRRSATLLPRDARCVAVLADGGSRYLDTVFDDEWVFSELGCSRETLERRVARPGAVRAADRVGAGRR